MVNVVKVITSRNAPREGNSAVGTQLLDLREQVALLRQVDASPTVADVMAALRLPPAREPR